MTVLMSGINMYSMALVMKVVLGWDLNFSIWVSSITVAVYVALGGLRSAIFNEVLQFILIWVGRAADPHSGPDRSRRLDQPARTDPHNLGRSDYVHLWRTLGHFSANPMGVHWTGIVFGLGLRDQLRLLDHRLPGGPARALREQPSLRRMAPIIGAAFKMVVPFIVILPGLLALCRVAVSSGRRRRRRWPAGMHSYNEVLPLMLVRYCGPGLLGLGVTALIAGFMSGMAGNVSAFSTVWTYDIYGAFLNKKATDAHYVAMGRWCTLVGVLVSVGTAYLVQHAASIMDYVQQLFSFFIAPLFGTVILGMLWKRATKAGGFWGLLAGTVTSIGLWGWVQRRPLGTALRGALARRQGHGGKHVSGFVVVDRLRHCDRGGQLADQARPVAELAGWSMAPPAFPRNTTTTGIKSPLYGHGRHSSCFSF